MRAPLVSCVLCVGIALSSGCVLEDECVVEGATRDATGRCAARVDAGTDGGRFDAGVDGGPRDASMGADGIDVMEGGRDDLGTPDMGCGISTAEVPVSGDIMFASSMCDGANHYGAALYLNLGVGTGLFRFALNADLQTALAEGRVVGARLILVRESSCDGSACPAVAGSLRVRPMRSDWDEGSDGTPTFVSRAGCDWCRRAGVTSPVRWGGDGATQMGVDVGPIAGRAAHGVDEPSLTIELDPTGFYDWMAAGSEFLSFQTVPESGVFTSTSREHAGAEHARLQLDFCPP